MDPGRSDPVGPRPRRDAASCVERSGRRALDNQRRQFVSLALSSVCLSCSRVMRDSQAAWHCGEQTDGFFLSSVPREGRSVTLALSSGLYTPSVLIHEE